MKVQQENITKIAALQPSEYDIQFVKEANDVYLLRSFSLILILRSTKVRFIILFEYSCDVTFFGEYFSVSGSFGELVISLYR